MLQSRDTLTRRLVHDMRNPLSGIVLYAQLLQRQGEYNKEQQRYLAFIQEEAQRLRLLLNQMQLLNKLQQGHQKLNRQLTDLRSFVREITSKAQVTAKVQSNQLRVAIPRTPIPPLSVDRNLMQQILEILLDHAVHFTPVQVPIVVEMDLAIETTCAQTVWPWHAPMLYLSITDQGPPIPEPLVANLYDSFETWDVVAPERAGMGISLALCKMIAEVHEGALAITNQTPRGVRFVLALPIPSSAWLPSAHDCQDTTSWLGEPQVAPHVSQTTG